jgi:acetolactate synthase-1/2/3 large subunit
MTKTNPRRQPARSAQRVVEALTSHGVEHVFGVPGAKIDAVFDVLADMGPRLVVCRHEQNAAFMAGAIGRLTGTPGVVLVTSGPGTTNLATGLQTATTEQDPIVALCGAVGREDRLKRTHQSMDAAAVMKTVTKFTGEVSTWRGTSASTSHATYSSRTANKPSASPCPGPWRRA